MRKIEDRHLQKLLDNWSHAGHALVLLFHSPSPKIIYPHKKEIKGDPGGCGVLV